MELLIRKEKEAMTPEEIGTQEDPIALVIATVIEKGVLKDPQDVIEIDETMIEIGTEEIEIGEVVEERMIEAAKRTMTEEDEIEEVKETGIAGTGTRGTAEIVIEEIEEIEIVTIIVEIETGTGLVVVKSPLYTTLCTLTAYLSFTEKRIGTTSKTSSCIQSLQ